MNMKSKLGMVAALAMLSATTGNLFDPEEPKKPKPRKLTFNERKKCFKQDCTNHRTGTSLYCSDECQKEYHKYLQDKI